MCAAALLLFTTLRPAALSFDVGSPPTPGSVSEWIAATLDAALPVRFSEGSSLVLAAGARVRVTETSSQGAGVLIERGKVHATIQHAGNSTQWTLRAGPFEVHVVGTTFDAQWDPGAEVFDLSMKEGSVTVTGPFLPSERAILAGERLQVSIREKRVELRTAQAELPSPPEQTPAAEPAPAAPPEAPADPAIATPSAARASAAAVKFGCASRRRANRSAPRAWRTRIAVRG